MTRLFIGIYKRYHVGLPGGVRKKSSYAGHVNLMTVKHSSLLKVYNFAIVNEQGIHRYVRCKVLDVIDRLFSKIPSLAHSIAINQVIRRVN